MTSEARIWDERIKVQERRYQVIKKFMPMKCHLIPSVIARLSVVF